ncbi:MAG: polysaccharide biosynthesis protein [Clostridiales bacterium]|nr:polysaccharide biosynthesis protein [Clostridiales bacterium]
MSKKSFVKGAGILALSGLIVKFIGAVFRIPLMNIIGPEGIGLYQLAYPIYAFLLVASTAGLPVAISKMVSEEVAAGNHYGGYKIFRISRRILFFLGIITSIVLLVGSGLVSKIQGNPKSVYALMAISPALFFVSVMSAYRGYFQGMHIMYPTALSQITEQLGKLIMGLTLAALWLPKGPEFAAAGAILGVTLSEAAALVLLLGIFRRKKRPIFKDARLTYRAFSQRSSEDILRRLIGIAIPVTIGASIMPLVNFSDQIIVVNRLAPIVDKIAKIPFSLESFIQFINEKGIQIVPGLTLENMATAMPGAYGEYTKMIATRLYGVMTGGVNTLINFPTVLTIALAMSLVPAISESFALKDKKGVVDKTTLGVRLTLLVGVPAAVGLGVLAGPVLKALYPRLQEWELSYGKDLLVTMSVGVVFLTLVQTLTAILQGVGKIGVPVINLLIGAVLKVVITILLVANPAFNIQGAAIGTVACYAVAALLNLISVVKYTGMGFSLKDFIVKPAINTGIMGVAVYYSYGIIFSKTGRNIIGLGASIILGAGIYAIMLLVTRTIKAEDLESIPKGKAIAGLLSRIGLLK